MRNNKPEISKRKTTIYKGNGKQPKQDSMEEEWQLPKEAFKEVDKH